MKDDQLYTILDHIEHLDCLVGRLKYGDNRQAIVNELTRLLESLKKLESENDIVITPSDWRNRF